MVSQIAAIRRTKAPPSVGIRPGSHTPPLIFEGLSTECRAIVVLPVRNEEGRVARSLSRLARQTTLNGRPLTDQDYEIIVLLNNCEDGSHSEVDAVIAAHPHVRIHTVTRQLHRSKANIGYVRQLLMDEACRRFLREGKADGAILSTDADTLVGPTWVAENQQVLADGWDAVGGRIVLDRMERRLLPAHVQRRYLLDIAYNLLRSELEALLDPVASDPWPRHHQHFAASLGVKAHAYQRVGGVPDVKHLEDVALWDALLKDGARLRHSPEIRVQTSARMSGRTLLGLSTHLCGFDTHCDPMMESAASLVRRFKMRRHCRLTAEQGARCLQTLPEAVRALRSELHRYRVELAILP